MGIFISFLTKVISSLDPPKYFESVKIDSPLELAISYPLLIFCTSASKFISGFDGDFLLNSEIIPDFSINDFLREITSLSKNKDFSISEIELLFF